MLGFWTSATVTLREELSQLYIKKCSAQVVALPLPHIGLPQQWIREKEENGFVVPLCIALTTLRHSLGHRRSLASGRSQPTLSLCTTSKGKSQGIFLSLAHARFFESFENKKKSFFLVLYTKLLSSVCDLRDRHTIATHDCKHQFRGWRI